MRIISLAEEKPKSTGKVTKLKDGGYIVSIAIYNEDHYECESIMIPSGIELNLDDLKA